MATDRPALVIDGMSMFIRCWAAYPTMSSHGHQVGGCVGFLKTMRRLVSDIQPSAVYVCWEGGGSSRRRAIFSEYKLNRRPEKLNRFYEDDIPDTDENRKHQLVTLIDMLKSVPVCQLYVSDCEGDDLVAYLCCGPLRGTNKVIVSSDKDLYQLLGEGTTMYSLHKKTFVTRENVFEETRVRAKHFAIAKALHGDPGDNVPGIRGMGFKTIAKLFPMLGTDEDLLLQDVVNYACAHSNDAAGYKRVAEQASDVARNWRLVHLDGGMLSAAQQQSIDKRISGFTPRADRVGLVRKLVEEGIGDFYVDELFGSLACVSVAQHGG